MAVASPEAASAWYGAPMSKGTRDKVHGLFTKLFDGERAVRATHDSILDEKRESVLDAAAVAVTEALALGDEEEVGLRLSRVAAILDELGGDRAVDLLIAILGSDAGEARHAAGEGLTNLAFDRFKEVALGVERALKRLPIGDAALPELPFVLLEVPEPGVARIFEKFLAHADGEAVAAAIEASAELGDRSLLPALEKLANDDRIVDLADAEGETGRVRLGDLAVEAAELLKSVGARGD